MTARMKSVKVHYVEIRRKCVVAGRYIAVFAEFKAEPEADAFIAKEIEKARTTRSTIRVMKETVETISLSFEERPARRGDTRERAYDDHSGYPDAGCIPIHARSGEPIAGRRPTPDSL